MTIFKKWNDTSLILRILGGLILGAILGLAVPGQAWIGIFGELCI